MEGRVALYNAEDIKIGETFVRRARQLVKQQRAHWVNERQDAIRFVPGLDTTMIPDDEDTERLAIKPAASAKPDEAWLFDMAKKRIKERKLFIAHSVAVIPVIFLSMFIYVPILQGLSWYLGYSHYLREVMLLFMGVSWGFLLTSYGFHFFIYRKKWRKIHTSNSARRERALAAEVEILRQELCP